ncbi:PREDICTED: pentatricopeptide repeat-containing protein At1g71210 [Tarenaya hassleriana]|uniref:pentatricopeptide repeat-containing protein At1g71210 n=1 Tax=Tarenaya hassleriana TaxID=28532 RepID=UPI00053C56F2|nr:PREDICTED: pentatricopeptide repeat-containing protein At1g71210 [Tarenaya hassleriana]XP_010521288.1 PREDICTED: pentatricopeptide repeat-containing protein At1g71210 [Tarenaya hassleriana]XP_010521289.1 PREDICTED: pentatricopeptide repeat-containing protein At1g71210 [Tarenaya hassleriana]
MRRILLQKLHAWPFRSCGSFAQNRSFSEALTLHYSAGEASELQFSTGDIVGCLKDWFKSSPHIQADRFLDLNRIFEILRSPSASDGGEDLHLRLSRLGIRLSEELILRVLSFGGNDVASCIKFFDWASRQPGFYHSRATFHAYFKLLHRAGLTPDFSIPHSLRVSDALVIGYSLVGQVDVALRHFGSMRFRGLDLDSFGYHVLLNALVEESYFDTVDVIVDQISSRGFVCGITHSILVKSFCKQGKLTEAENYVRSLLKTDGDPDGFSTAYGLVVDALCSRNLFRRAARLLDEVRELGTVRMDRGYSIWIKALIRARSSLGAVHFLHKLNSLGDGRVVDVFTYNALVLQLLRENRLMEVCDVIIEMMEQGVSPDKGTMNAVLCFFCKAGLVDIALELCRSRSEIGLALTTMAYNYLINTLCEQDHRSVERAYGIFKASIDQGHFPGRYTLHILAKALCEKGKLENMKELSILSLRHRLLPSGVAYGRFVSALCKAGKLEDGLLIRDDLVRAGIDITANMFISLITVSVRSNKGDIAAKLLIEMQKKGYAPAPGLYRSVIQSLCGMENCMDSFFNLLEVQLRLLEDKVKVYNRFIDGAGHAGKPELTAKVYKMMMKDQIRPTLASNILLLKCYIRAGKFSDAVNFFDALCEKGEVSGKLYHTMIRELCKAKKGNIALMYFDEMKRNGLLPSIECYERVITHMCTNGMYETGIRLVSEFRKTGRPLTAFIGNNLLFNALKTRGIYEAWIRMRDDLEVTPQMRLLGELIGIFSGRVRVMGEIKTLDEVIEKCYPLSIFTYNMLLRRLMMERVDDALEMVKRLCQRGYEPDQWTHMIIYQGLREAGRWEEAEKWLEATEASYQTHGKGR